MKRRSFLKHTAAATTLPVLIGGMNITAFGRNSLFASMLRNAAETGHVLVLIQLNGGNDGLATVIPLDQYDRLQPVRSNIIIPEASVLKLTDETGLHPAMGGIKSLINEEKVGILQSVGYPNPNFSHFRSTDIWETGSASEVKLTSGWMGRYLDQVYPGFPDGYPNAEMPDPLAITIGSIVSNTCQGAVTNLGMAITDPEAFSRLLEGGVDEAPNTPYGHELTFLRQTMQQTNRYIEVIQAAVENQANLSDLYPEPRSNRLADELKIVAQLIGGGLKTSVYVVNLGGFDTHANQVNPNDPLAGEHANLLNWLSEAIVAFQDDIEKMGVADRVVGMTYSEFGRRIQSNGSFGTDHGAAAPLMVFGHQVNPIIHGNNPQIPEEVDVKDSLPMQFDFRSVYGSILMDWFDAPEDLIKDILFQDFQHIPVIKSSSVDREQELHKSWSLHQNYPNPFRSSTRIRFETEGGWVQIKVFNSMGQEIETVTDRHFGPGVHELFYDGHRLSRGIYYYRMQYGNQQAVKMMSKR
ncbi:MAG: DUF1501 domain-containing protein [Bacteroidetes bacterium]|nr:MAG: DUF1501 domain-containing protein [Bacteroidota bacterium]